MLENIRKGEKKSHKEVQILEGNKILYHKVKKVGSEEEAKGRTGRKGNGRKGI